MRGNEIYKALEDRKRGEHRFVKWWRKENDFLDYDLVDRFVDNFRGSDEIDGFDLLTMDDMWKEVERVCGRRITLRHETNADLVEWVHGSSNGTHTEVCIFSPETVMHIYDVETRGNPVV